MYIYICVCRGYLYSCYLSLGVCAWFGGWWDWVRDAAGGATPNGAEVRNASCRSDMTKSVLAAALRAELASSCACNPLDKASFSIRLSIQECFGWSILVHRRLRKTMLPHGLEPWTSRLLAERSSQLSYESSWRKVFLDGCFGIGRPMVLRFA